MSLSSLSAILSPTVIESVKQLDFSLDSWRHNPRIGQLLGATVLQGGKRLRPVMTFLMADLFGIDHARIAVLGRMIELVHASTLAHDDVVDNADTRRSLPSINAVAGNKRAVLAGDYLLAYVLQEIAATGRGDLLSEMAGIIGDLAEGEWLQMENSESEQLTWEAVEAVARKKTGSVLRWCCVAPAMLDHHDEDILSAARRLGESIGIAFQLTDDILDFKRDDAAALADIKNRVVSAVIFEALCVAEGSESIDMGKIRDITPGAELEEGIQRVRRRVDRLVEEADELLQVLARAAYLKNGRDNSEALQTLRWMIRYLAKRI